MTNTSHPASAYDPFPAPGTVTVAVVDHLSRGRLVLDGEPWDTEAESDTTIVLSHPDGTQCVARLSVEVL